MSTVPTAGAMPANLALARASAQRAIRMLDSFDANLSPESTRNARVIRQALASINDAIVAAAIAGEAATVTQLTRAARQLQTPYGMRYVRDLVSHGIALLRS